MRTNLGAHGHVVASNNLSLILSSQLAESACLHACHLRLSSPIAPRPETPAASAPPFARQPPVVLSSCAHGLPSLLAPAQGCHLNHPAVTSHQKIRHRKIYCIHVCTYMYVWNCWRINKKYSFKKDRKGAALTGKNKFYRQGQVQQTRKLLLANCSHTGCSVDKVCPRDNRRVSVCDPVPLLKLRCQGDNILTDHRQSLMCWL